MVSTFRGPGPPTEAVPLRTVKTAMRIRWPRCYNLLSVSVIRNCPQRFSESSVLRTLGGSGSPESPTTTIVGLVSRQRSGSRAGFKRLLLMTGHADTASPKQGASSINCERALQYRVRGAPVPTTRNRGTNYPNRQASGMGLGRS